MGQLYILPFKNFEETDVEITIEDMDISAAFSALEGSAEPCVISSVNLDDDKTATIKSRRMKIGFNSNEFFDLDNFSDGSHDRFLATLDTGSSIPFVGNLVLDDNSEAFQPKPNPVTLYASEGINSLKTVELTESDGDLPRGHYRVIDYIYLCLRNLAPNQGIHVVFNLYEQDTDPDASHAFIDTYLDARTFEKDADTREDCFTVLQKILDAFGCFICYDNDGWYIIRWDEFDKLGGGVTTLRSANFDSDGNFVDYTNLDLNKAIAHDESGEYEGYYLSQNTAERRFQSRVKEVKHIYKLEQPKEVPCNSDFLRGEVDDDTLPLKTFVPDCWTLRRGWPGDYEATTVEMRIGVRYDTNEYEEERFLYLTPTAFGVDDPPEYAESEAIDVHEKDKFELSVNWRTETIAPGAFGNQQSLMRVRLHGDDGSDWLLGNEDVNDDTTPLKWYDTSNFTANLGAGNRGIDTTLIEEQEWQSIDLGESPPIPVDGKLYIMLEQFNQIASVNDDLAIDYSDLKFTYIPYIAGTYHRITAQENSVSGDESRRNIEHEMFISDSPKKLLKGALKKFNGVDYVLTENWNDYNSPTVLPDSRLAKFIVYQWFNQYRKTRTVIESDIQGLNTDEADGIPGFIHRWKIHHANEADKYFMLTSFRNMNFYNCGWIGVFVEMSDTDGDRNYEHEWTFKYIRG